LSLKGETVREVNLVLAGVGGQGTILMSELLGNASVMEGLRVRGAEVLGMAQRGGSVMTLVRFGSEVHAPLVPEGKGDVMVSMEPSESLRNILYLAKGGTAIINLKRQVPPSTFLKISKYGDINEILSKIRQHAGKVMTLDAISLAEKAGSTLAANVVMLGALIASGKVPLKPETIRKVLSERFKGKTLEINLKAFELGMNAVKT